MNAFELQSLTKTFGAVRALDDASATVPVGSVGLLGPNGAGKTTLVKCLLGLVRPSSGRGAVLGLDIAKDPLAIRKRIGYLPEVDCYIPGMTAVEFVGYTGELSGMARRDAVKRAHEVLDYVGIDEERYRRIDTYSTGMRQKVKLAQAIVHDPELLFLDEPTNGLDPEGRERMLALVGDLGTNHGIGIVYSSHLLHDVEEVCSHVLILRDGQVVAQDVIANLRAGTGNGFEVRLKGEAGSFVAFLEGRGALCRETSPGCFRITFAELPSDPAKLVFEAARHESLQVRTFRPVRSTLEDFFLERLESGAGTQNI